MSKPMTAEEFASWAERHTPEQVLGRSIELQNELVTDLAASAGVDSEEYERAGLEERQMIVEAGGQVWLAEQAECEAAERAANPPEVGRIFISEESDDDTVEIEVPYGGALDKKLDRGMVKGSFDEDSPEGQEAVQATFVATHPEFKVSLENGNALRDRVEANGHKFFTVSALEEALQQLVFEGKIDIPDEFGR